MRWGPAVTFFVCLGACGLFPDVSSLGPSSGTDGGDAAAVDAPPTANEGGASPCATTHDFCDDFDHGPLGATWDQIVSQAGPLALSSTAVTPPSALGVTVLDSAQTAQASMLEKQFPSSKHVHVELDAQVTSPSNAFGTEVDFVTLEVTPPAGYDEAGLSLFRRHDSSTPGPSVLQYFYIQGSNVQTIDEDVAEDFSSWRHVALDADFDAQTFAVAIDGTPVTQLDMSPTVPMGAFTLQVGATWVDDVQATWGVLVDDVTLDRQ